MKYIRLSTVIGFSLRFTLLLSLVTTLTPAASENYKIGVVDTLAVLEQSPQADQMATQLRLEFEGRNRELIDMQRRLTDLSERLTNDSLNLSSAETASLERELQLQRRELARAETQYKEDFSFRRNEILVALQNDILRAIKTVSEQYQFDIVLTGGVNWASPRINMTPLVVEYLRNNQVE